MTTREPSPHFVVSLTPDDDDMIEFRWHGSLTVSVFAGGVEVDVFTFADQPNFQTLKAGCRRYLRDAG